MKHKQTKQNPAIVGFSFIRRPVLELLLRNSYDVKVWSNDQAWSAWIAAKHTHPTIAIIEDRTVFDEALSNCGTTYLLVREGFDWLSKKHITSVDAQLDQEGLIVVKSNMTVNQLKAAFKQAKPYQADKYTQLTATSNTAGSCAGCTLLLQAQCSNKTPRSKSCSKYKLATAEDSAVPYSLNQLVAKCLLAADIDMLVIAHKAVWKHTYKFAVGKLTRKQWIGVCGRQLLTAKVPKADLRRIGAWVKQNGKALRQGATGPFISKIDKKLAALIKKKS